MRDVFFSALWVRPGHCPEGVGGALCPSRGRHSARYPDLTPLQRNVLHTVQAVHEVVVEEHGILGSANNSLSIYTPADWVRLFEARFSLSVEHLRQRFPQGLAHCSLCWRASLPGFSHAWPCVLPVTLSERAKRPRPSRIGRCLVLHVLGWSGPASCCQGEVGSVVLLLFPALCVSGLFSKARTHQRKHLRPRILLLWKSPQRHTRPHQRVSRKSEEPWWSGICISVGRPHCCHVKSDLRLPLNEKFAGLGWIPTCGCEVELPSRKNKSESLVADLQAAWVLMFHCELNRANFWLRSVQPAQTFFVCPTTRVGSRTSRPCHLAEVDAGC